MLSPWWRILAGIVLPLLASHVIRAERLPVKHYTVADGLAQGSVYAIHQDARGFLWLATRDGLSRFDGYRFTNYGVKDGLGNAQINDVVQDQRGRLWVATNGGGVALLLDEASAKRQGRKFLNFLIKPDSPGDFTNRVNGIVFDADNRLWCSTDSGLYRARSLEVVSEQFELVSEPVITFLYPVLHLDRRGRVWASVRNELLLIEGGGVTTYLPWREAGETPGRHHRFINGIVELKDGRLLFSTQKDLYEFIEPAAAGQRGSWRRLPLALPPLNTIGTIHPAADGGLWIGTDGGLLRYRDGQQVNYRIGNDPNPFKINTFHSDPDGNLWIGTRQRGLLKLRGESVMIYDVKDGLLPVEDVYWLKETHDGRMILQGRAIAPFGCNETFLTAGNGALTRLRPPPSFCVHDVLQDSRKNWWVLLWRADRKAHGLRVIPGPKLDWSAGYELTEAYGWVGGSYGNLREDSGGHVWFGRGNRIFYPEYTGSGRPRLVEALKADPRVHVLYFLRDPSDTIWWSDNATVWRRREGKTGKIETVALPVEKPDVRNFYLDRRNRLWISTLNHGVLMTDAPNSDAPRFINYTTAQGLANNWVEDVCEDDDGNLWFGALRGLYWLDERTGRFNHVSHGENTLSTAVRELWKDRRGYLWATVLGAVIRINPRLTPRPALQLPIYFNRIKIAGEPLALGETGAVNLAPLELAAGTNNLDIEFVSPNFRDETAVRYQYKLDGVDADWNPPGNAREVNDAQLAPGDYRFVVRAVNESGVVSAAPASLQFRILRPIQQRWWFLAALGLGLGGLFYGGYRYRLEQAVRVERVRTRIAHDLHDDIGANLTRISILSEVAKQQQSNGAPPPAELLDSIADISRESVAAMNDIVWAINPQHDSLLNLIGRMRRHAEEVFLSRNIRLEFEAPGNAERLKLDIETRRDLYLIFKEAVNNAARHAACSAVRIQIEAGATRIQLTVHDNGKGFDPSSPVHSHGEGNGLLSMRNRARTLGGELVIDSVPGTGSELRLTIPL